MFFNYMMIRKFLQDKFAGKFFFRNGFCGFWYLQTYNFWQIFLENFSRNDLKFCFCFIFTLQQYIFCVSNQQIFLKKGIRYTAWK